jgi:PIN domain nuclease of toxin-antitoxin system
MKLLLDTHTFMWLDSNPDRLSARAKSLLDDTENDLLLSVASLWEIQIKVAIGKQTLSAPLEDLVAHQRAVNSIEVIPIVPEHVYQLRSLPLHHKDPFDRLLIAAAVAEDAVLVSDDGLLKRYPVRIEW